MITHTPVAKPAEKKRTPAKLNFKALNNLDGGNGGANVYAYNCLIGDVSLRVRSIPSSARVSWILRSAKTMKKQIAFNFVSLTAYQQGNVQISEICSLLHKLQRFLLRYLIVYLLNVRLWSSKLERFRSLYLNIHVYTVSLQ